MKTNANVDTCLLIMLNSEVIFFMDNDTWKYRYNYLLSTEQNQSDLTLQDPCQK